jgi:hypothetical protein
VVALVCTAAAWNRAGTAPNAPVQAAPATITRPRWDELSPAREHSCAKDDQDGERAVAGASVDLWSSYRVAPTQEDRSISGSSRAGLRTLALARMAAIAYVDPGNFAVNVSAGAEHGYTLSGSSSVRA